MPWFGVLMTPAMRRILSLRGWGSPRAVTLVTPQAFLGYLRTVCGLPDVLVADLRAIMPTLTREACAIAGQAAALSQWHQVRTTPLSDHLRGPTCYHGSGAYLLLGLD